VGGFFAAMMCSKVFLSEALEYTLTTNWAAGYRNHDVAQNSLDQDSHGWTFVLAVDGW